MDNSPPKYKRILPKPLIPSSTLTHSHSNSLPSLPEYFTKKTMSRSLPLPKPIPFSYSLSGIVQSYPPPNNSNSFMTACSSLIAPSSSSSSSVVLQKQQAQPSTQPVDKVYSLKWTDFGKQLTSHFAELYNRRDTADMSIICGQDHEILRAHQLVLSLGSLYFKDALQSVPNKKHPSVVVRHVTGHSMGKILDYVYLGHVTLASETELKSFFSQAKYLQVVGIEEGKYALG